MRHLFPEPIIVTAILVGLPRSIEQKLTQQTISPDIQLLAAHSADVDELSALVTARHADVVIIDSTQIWAGGLARGLRARHADTRVLILGNPRRLTGYILYDYDHAIENAAEPEMLHAIEAVTQNRSFR